MNQAPSPPPRHKCCSGPPQGCPGPWRRSRWVHRVRCRWGWRAWGAGLGGVSEQGLCRLPAAAEVWRGWAAWAWTAGKARTEGEQGGELSLLFSRSVATDSATPWTAGRQASLSFTISQSLVKLMSNESVMPRRRVGHPNPGRARAGNPV